MIWIIALTNIFVLSIWLGQTVSDSPPPPPWDRSDHPPHSQPDSYLPPYPPYPYDSFCPGHTPGFLNDPCSEEDPCYNDYSIECNNGTCSCVHDFMPSSLNNGLCEAAPSLNEPCDGVCQTPLKCRKNQGSTTAAPVTMESNTTDGITEATPTTPPPPSKTCQCVPPYSLQNGYNCRLNCSSDEYYDEKDGKCKPRCQSDQVKLKNGYCAPIAQLGEKCKADLQCTQEFSVCRKGKCACRRGFQSKGKECVPKKYLCPWSSPLKENGEVVECNVTEAYYPSYRPKDSCPSTAYCLTTPTSAYYPNNVKYGFCCPKPDLECPVGKPIQNTTCYTYYPVYARSSSAPPKQCPYQTHYCYTVNVGQGAYSESLCCPKACQENFVLVDGVCYQQVQYGDQCVVDEQCAQSNAICGKNGTCHCSPNGQPQNYDGDPRNTQCVINCAPDQVLIDQQCYKRHKLGEECGDDQGNLCPNGAGCDPNRGNTCQCYCNNIPIGDSRCEQYPVCRKNYVYPPYDAEGRGGGSGTTTASPDQTTTPCYDTTQTPPPPPEGNFTFCRVTGENPPVDAVENCPDGEFCNYYVQDLGLCCPIPDQVCEDGSQSNDECSPNVPGSCPPNQSCYKYFSAVGGEPHQGSICCPNDGTQYPVPPYDNGS